MVGRIVEVMDDRRHLSLSRGFLIVEDTQRDRAEIGRVPLDDIIAVIANAHGLSYTNSLLVALSERGAPFVICSANHNAVGMLLSIDGNSQQAKRFDAQLRASKPTCKRLWAEIVKSKLQQQYATLEAVSLPTAPIEALVSKVRSGDPDNIEAQAARRYWTLLFGDGFRRDHNGGGLNAMLNYGYTVLRACTARAVVAAGLHPTVALHHSNEGNAMRLVDDLMEPFRPVVDLTVWRLDRIGQRNMSSETKRELVKTLYLDMQSSSGATPLLVCIQRLATSLAQVFLSERDKLDLPLPGLPITLVSNLA